MKKLKRLVIDIESYWDREEVTLRKLTPPEYIHHPKFQIHLIAVFGEGWSAPKVLLPHEFESFFRDKYPPEETMAISHNMLFDGAVMGWKLGWVPARLTDTLGLARALRSYKKYSLGSVTKELFGQDLKGDTIGKVAGLDVQGIKRIGLWGEYCTYAMRDAHLCALIYRKLVKEFPEEEQRIMDLVLRCAITPVLTANKVLLEQHLIDLRARKAELLQKCGYDKAALMSTKQFQAVLEGLGVEIDYKESPTPKLSAAGRLEVKFIPQFSKTDAFMAGLLEYAKSPDDNINYQVQTLAAARLSHKSTIEETRAEKFLNIAQLPWINGGGNMPVALRYGGAHTHRLSGEWRLNMQNLPRDKTKSRLREALRAPPGFKIVAADLSQIEARLVAVLCGEAKLIKQFSDGDDVYAQFASIVFQRTVTKKTHPHERFLGKTAILGLGYGCGWRRYYQMVTAQAGQAGIPLEGLFDEDIARSTVNTYRTLYSKIEQAWKDLDKLLESHIKPTWVKANTRWPAKTDWLNLGVDGPVEFMPGRILLPNGLYLRYLPDTFNKIYGARLLENITQALARIIVMQAAVRLADRGYRFVLQAHDELVFVVPDGRVDEAKGAILDEMVRVPSWLPGLPLAAEVGVGQNYGSVK